VRRTGLAFAILALVACEQQRVPVPEPPASSAPKLDEVPRPAAGATETTLSGEVVEKLSVPSYSYLRLKTASGEAWTAVPTADVKVGDRVTVERAMLMNGFRSTALGRDFDRVYFGTLAGGKPPAAPAAHGTGSAPALPAIPAKLAKAPGPEGKTVAEVVAQAKRLAKRTVSVRAVVVKANAGILGKTWLHLRDGSGSEADKTNDLTVTVADGDPPAIGDVVVVKGTVAIDQDVGGGYRFPVLLEGSSLERESGGAK
jgi:hypothetical protein